VPQTATTDHILHHSAICISVLKIFLLTPGLTGPQPLINYLPFIRGRTLALSTKINSIPMRHGHNGWRCVCGLL